MLSKSLAVIGIVAASAGSAPVQGKLVVTATPAATSVRIADGDQTEAIMRQARKLTFEVTIVNDSKFPVPLKDLGDISVRTMSCDNKRVDLSPAKWTESDQTPPEVLPPHGSKLFKVQAPDTALAAAQIGAKRCTFSFAVRSTAVFGQKTFSSNDVVLTLDR